MADEAISQLTAYATYHSDDELEVLDVHDTTFATSGTNKRLTFASLISLAGIRTGTVATSTGGTGLTATGTADQLLGVVHTGSGLEYKTLTAGSGITITPAAGSITIAATGGGGSGTVTSVGLALPAIFTVSGSPVTGSGTLTGTLATQSANLVFAGPSTGVAAAPTFRALVIADLPTAIPNANLANASVTISGHSLALGGTLALASGDVSGLAASATTDTTNASNITSGTLGAARLPNPSATALGGVQSAAAVTHQWIDSISTLGVPHLSQPAFSDISGTVAASQLPNPSATTLGGVQSAAAVSHQWIASISTSGVPSLSQPAFTDLSGTAAVGQLPVMVASGASHAAGIAPDPGSTAGTTKFLREDATWAVPAGGGSGSPGGSSGQIQYNSSGAFAGAANITVGASGQLNLGAIAAPGSPTDGDLWYDSAQLAHGRQQSGMTTWPAGLLFSQTTPVTVTATGASSLVSTTSALGTLTLPAGFLNVIGKTLSIRFGGYMTTAASAAGTWSLFIKLGTSIVATGTNLSLVNAVTSRPWMGEIFLTCVGTGASGKLETHGQYAWPLGSAQVQAFALVGNGTAVGIQAAGSPVTLDLTASYALDLQVQIGSSGNSVTLTHCLIDIRG